MYAEMGGGKGGAESVFDRVARGLERRGHSVCRVLAESEGDAELDKSSVAGDAGKVEYLPLFTPPTWKGFLRPSFLARFVTSLVRLYRLLGRVQPEVVNYHYLSPNALHFLILKSIFGYRLVLSCHGSDVLSTAGLREKLYPILGTYADETTVVSDSIGRGLQRRFSDTYQPTTIHNGIDLEFWKDGSMPRHESEANGSFRLVTVGSLKRVKGHDVLIRAFEQIADRYPSAELRIIGDGPLRDEYEALIRDLDLAERVTITGWCSAEEVRSQLQSASVFVFPSRHEGFGLALLEAMAAGLSVIASDVGGVPEVVGTEYELLVPPESPEELGDAVCELLEDSSMRRRASRQCQERTANFSWENVVSQYESALAEAGNR